MMLRSRMFQGPAAWLALVAVFLSLAGVAPAQARTTGIGEIIRGPTRLHMSAHQPPASFGRDAVRVTFLPAFGCCWTVELHPVDADRAIGDIVFDGRQPGAFGGWLRLRLS